MNDAMLKLKEQLKQNNKIDLINETEELQGFENDNLLVANDQKIDTEILKDHPPNEDFKYIFYPKKNISTYDLARILAFTQLMITDNIYDKIPDDLKQHFTKFTELN